MQIHGHAGNGNHGDQSGTEALPPAGFAEILGDYRGPAPHPSHALRPCWAAAFNKASQPVSASPRFESAAHHPCHAFDAVVCYNPRRWPRDGFAYVALLRVMRMTIDDGLKLLEAVTRLFGVLVWPLVVVFVLVRFGPALRDFVASLGQFSLKGPGFEASLTRKQAEAAVALTAAVVSRPEPGASPEATASDARAAFDVVAEVATPRVIRQAAKSSLLWVDDKPSNNLHERHALEALGIDIALATSTDQALENLKRQSFDVIISDMGRPPDAQAGYTLLDKLRASGDRTPFIIYAGSRAPEHRAEARRRGALGCTNRPDELFEMVLSALGRAA